MYGNFTKISFFLELPKIFEYLVHGLSNVKSTMASRNCFQFVDKLQAFKFELLKLSFWNAYLYLHVHMIPIPMINMPGTKTDSRFCVEVENAYFLQYKHFELLSIISF